MRCDTIAFLTEDDMTQAQRPTKNAQTGDEEHPAYAMVGAYRSSSMASPTGKHAGHGHVLFGSDFRHQHFMSIVVRPASLRRDLSHDYIHAGSRQYLEIQMSEAQWATFISTPNMGSGVPATLTYLTGEGDIPTIDHGVRRKEEFHNEVDERLQHAVRLIRELDADIEAAKLSRKDKEALRTKTHKAAQELDSNLGFVADSFDQHAEETVEKAKIEMETYLTGVVMRAGIKTLGGEAPPMLELAEGE